MRLFGPSPSVNHVEFYHSNSTLPMDVVVEEYASVIAQDGGMVNSNEFVELSSDCNVS